MVIEARAEIQNWEEQERFHAVLADDAIQRGDVRDSRLQQELAAESRKEASLARVEFRKFATVT